jgi:hypothetical protein
MAASLHASARSNGGGSGNSLDSKKHAGFT